MSVNRKNPNDDDNEVMVGQIESLLDGLEDAVETMQERLESTLDKAENELQQLMGCAKMGINDEETFEQFNKTHRLCADIAMVKKELGDLSLSMGDAIENVKALTHSLENNAVVSSGESYATNAYDEGAGAFLSGGQT